MAKPTYPDHLPPWPDAGAPWPGGSEGGGPLPQPADREGDADADD
jgi:hypothetical protein